MSANGPQGLQITGRQLALLRAIRRWSVEHGRMPSVRELAEVLERSASTVQQHLLALERRGYLKRSGETHGLSLLIEDDQLGLAELGAPILLPIKGTIEPGRPLIRHRSPYRRIAVGGGAKAGDYLLQVGGNRLETEGIFDRDLLVVRPGPAGNHPAILVFLDGTADIKRVGALLDGTQVLFPPHPRLDRRRGRRRNDPMAVQGRVLRVIREFNTLE